MNDEIELIIPTSWAPDRGQFLAALKIAPDGLGAQFFSNVFDALFVNSIELREEYRKYYGVEYSTLSDYVEIRYGTILDEEELEADYIFVITWLPQIVDSRHDDNKLNTVLECISHLEEAQGESQT